MGRPDPAKHLGPGDVFLVPFTLLWGGFAIFWLVSAITRSASPTLAIVGVPFVVIGLYLILGRFIVKAHRKRQTVYGLTEGRALVAVGSGSLSEAPLQRTLIGQRRSRDGRHLTVAFGSDARGWSSGPSYANSGLELFDHGGGPLGFYDVADADGLEAALRSVRR